MTSPRTERRVLGGAARRIREARGASLAAIGGKAGMSAGYLCKIEAGTKNPSLTKMVGLANALEVDLDDITYLTAVYVVADEDAA